MTVSIRVGSALDVLKTLPDASIQMCVTSPPYFGLRAYGTDPQVWGGDRSCEHEFPEAPPSKPKRHRDTDERREYLTAPPASWTKREATWDSGPGAFCPCGAWRGELGSEPTSALFIEHLVSIFDEVWRVLRPDGLVFCNLGDSYSGSGKGTPGSGALINHTQRQGFVGAGREARSGEVLTKQTGQTYDIPAKNLLLIPQRFAIAMQDRGWIVRSEIVWAKTSAMPESVRDRPTSAWEPIWMFAKSQRYFYDGDAVKQNVGAPTRRNAEFRGVSVYTNNRSFDNGAARPDGVSSPGAPSLDGANLRNVWLLGPEPLREQHYASYPTELVRRCILAGTSEKGACPACGAGWVRIADRVLVPTPKSKNGTATVSAKRGANRAPEDHRATWGEVHGSYAVTTTGWQPSCPCKDAGPPVAQTVLDPFLGSGTTAMVADRLGRDAIGIELSPTYAKMAEQRIASDAGTLFGDPVTVEAPRQARLFEEVSHG